MSKQLKYKNESDVVEKVYTDGITGPFKMLQPGETCTIRLDSDQEPRVLPVIPEAKAKTTKK